MKINDLGKDAIRRRLPAALDSQLTLAIEDSEILHRYRQELVDTRTKIATFDLFDTLIRRSCPCPESVFEEVGRLAVNEGTLKGIDPFEYRHLRREAEAEARRKIDAEDIRFNEIFEQMAFDDQIKQRLQMLELEIEQQMIHPDPIGIRLLNEAKKHEKPIIIVSDMYLPLDFITSIVDQHIRPYAAITEVFLSSENRLTKTMGSQFRHVKQVFGVEGVNIVHVGDNMHADVKSAQNEGCRAIYFGLPKWLTRAQRLEKHLGAELSVEVQQARTFASFSAPAKMNEAQKYFYNYGATILGPALVGFAKWSLNKSAELKVNEIVAIMREGGIFHDCLVREQEFKAYGNPVPISKLYASRRSTFLPSIDPNQLDPSDPEFTKQTRHAIDNAFNDLNTLANHRTYERNEPNSLGEALEIDFEVVQLGLKRSRDLLNTYFSQVRKSDGEYLVVDMGPNGTIHSQLNRALVEPPKQCLLFYAMEGAYKKGLASSVSAFLPFTEQTARSVRVVNRACHLIEAVLVGKEKSTVGYAEGDAGKILPVTHGIDHDENYYSLIECFELGVAHYHHWSQLIGADESSWNHRIAFIKVLERLIGMPDKSEVRWLNSKAHEESFIAEESYHMVHEGSLAEIKELGTSEFWRKLAKNPYAFYDTVPWPQGLVTMLDDDWILDALQINVADATHEHAIDNIIEQLKILQINEVNVYGAGEFYRELKPKLKSEGINIHALFDSKAKQIGSFEVDGILVNSPSRLELHRNIPFVIASNAFVRHIKTLLIEHGIRANQIINC